MEEENEELRNKNENMKTTIKDLEDELAKAKLSEEELEKLKIKYAGLEKAKEKSDEAYNKLKKEAKDEQSKNEAEKNRLNAESKKHIFDNECIYLSI